MATNWGFFRFKRLQIEGFLLFLRVRKILKYIKSYKLRVFYFSKIYQKLQIEGVYFSKNIKSYKLRVFGVWAYLKKQRRLGATTLLQRKRKEAPVHVGASSFSWHRFIYRERRNKKNSFSSWKVADLSWILSEILLKSIFSLFIFSLFMCFFF